jgi:precorrin-6B methylase 2
MEVSDMSKNKQQATPGGPLKPERIFEMAAAFQKSRILLTAFELELFSALGKEHKSSAQLAEALGIDERAADRLMNALCALELLEKNENKFSNSPLAQKFLVKDSPDFMGGLFHTNHLWDTWSTLTAAVEKGTSVIGKKVDDRGEKWLTAFIAAMHYRAQKQAPAVVAKLDLSGVNHVLDVGGGSGAFAMAFVKAKPDIQATVFDLPNVAPITRGYIEQEGFSNNVKIQTGDYHVNPLGNGYDLVFLSAIVHSNSFEENMKLLKKCTAALNPGGQVVVQDFIMDEDRTAPAFAAMFALNMLVGTEGGDTYTGAEVGEWMTGAGLSGIKRIDTPFGASLITGRLKKR